MNIHKTINRNELKFDDNNIIKFCCWSCLREYQKVSKYDPDAKIQPKLGCDLGHNYIIYDNKLGLETVLYEDYIIFEAEYCRSEIYFTASQILSYTSFLKKINIHDDEQFTVSYDDKLQYAYENLCCAE